MLIEYADINFSIGDHSYLYLTHHFYVYLCVDIENNCLNKPLPLALGCRSEADDDDDMSNVYVLVLSYNKSNEIQTKRGQNKRIINFIVTTKHVKN